jgi:hypothetical protein
VARAKRTNRAEARRRYRAQAAERAQAEAVEGRPAERPVAPERTPRATAEPPRRGLRYAFRESFRPVNLRDDLAHVGDIIGSPALWVGVAAPVVAALLLIATTGSDPISRIAAPFVLFPPPIIPIFIAGFFSRRASYVSGAIVGVVAVIAFLAVLGLNPASVGLVAPANQGGASPGASVSPAASASPASSAASASASTAASPAPSASPRPITEADVQAVKSQLTRDALTSPVPSIFFASAAAWYRRFLRLGNPNSPAARSGQRSRPNNRRR